MDLAYVLTVAGCAGGGLLALFPLARGWLAAWWLATLAAHTVLLARLGLASDHLPIFGENLEAKLAAAWLVSLAGLLAHLAAGRRRETPFVWLAVLAALAGTLHTPLAPHPDAFWYTHWTVVGFFLGRVLALAGVLFAGTYYGAAILDTEGEPARRRRLWIGRNWLLGGLVLFGVSELSGSLWALRGWGDFWLFNPGFFSSAGSFLVLVIPLHLSGRWTRDPRTLPTVGAAAAVVFLNYVLLRMH